jgi:hypothetical protein
LADAVDLGLAAGDAGAGDAGAGDAGAGDGGADDAGAGTGEAVAPGVPRAWPLDAARPARDGATVADRPAHPCQASSSPAIPATASRAIPHRPTGSPPSRMSAHHVRPGRGMSAS